ncbi:MAG: hypothetical protein ACE5OZ_16510 [Candidatus Heimdallarchaeota archaeon]
MNETPPPCPDCNGKMKWLTPFYVCQRCGLSLRRHELERMQDKIRDDLWDARYGQNEDEKSKRRREMVEWYLSGDKE